MTVKENSDGAVTVGASKGDREFSERLRLAMQGRKGTWLASQIGLKSQSVNAWLRGESVPSLINARDAATALGVSIQWLASGEGPMRPATDAPAPQATSNEPPLDKWLFSRVIGGIRTAYKVAGVQLPVVTEVDQAFEMHNRIAALTDVQEERYGALLALLDQLEQDLRSPRATGTEDTKRSA